jgi:hypothetical protein
MKKKGLKKVIDIIPSVLKNTAEWIKDNFEENSQEILKNSSGTIGILIKLIGQPLINKYFENLSKKKLDEYGMYTYMSAAYKQASKSISVIEDELKTKISSKYLLKLQIIR